MLYVYDNNNKRRNIVASIFDIFKMWDLFEKLPIEIICVDILTFFSIEDICNFSLVNKLCYIYCCNELLLWKNLNKFRFTNNKRENIINFFFKDLLLKNQWKKITINMTSISKKCKNNNNIYNAIEYNYKNFFEICPYITNKEIISNIKQLNKNQFLEKIYLLEQIDKCIIKGKNGYYYGETVKGEMEGYGIYNYDRERYEGEFKNGKRHGKGVFYYKNGDKYEGEFKNRCINEKGIAYYNDGDKYEGEFKKGEREGNGVYFYNNGDRYEGEFKNDDTNGKGIFYFENGDKYDGQVKDDAFEGKGIYYYKNGDRYEGEFKNDKKENGIFYYKNGDGYEEEFKTVKGKIFII